MAEFHLLIDDLRELNVDLTARNGEDGLAALREHGDRVTHLYMDHDLGEDTMDGYSVLSTALDEGIHPQTVILVTMNSVGRENMARALEAHGYRRLGQRFTKV